MVAPVVLITAGGILSNGVLTMSASVNDRMRAMNQERLGWLSGTSGAVQSVADLAPAGRERVQQIDRQLPMLVRRHHLLLRAVLTIYLAITILVVAVIVLGIAVTVGADAAGLAAMALVLAGTLGLLAALVVVARATILSHDAIDFETTAVLALGSD